MIPLGRCVLLWRLNRGLSQGALAVQAGMARPNLSNIEKGKREVSLRTLRALALALGIKPGVLADGVGPDPEGPSKLSRAKLERIAWAVVRNRELRDPRERELAEKMSLLLRPSLGAQGRGTGGRGRGGLAAQRAWLSLSGAHSAGEIKSLIKRVTEKAGNQPL